METRPLSARRPLSITIIALVQAALAAYCLCYLIPALLNPSQNLGALRSALGLLIGRIDCHCDESSHEEIVINLFFMAFLALLLIVFGVRTSWGLWRLEKWARHAVAVEYGVQLALWARSFFAFGVFGGLSHLGGTTLQPIYMLITVEAIICLTLWFHGGVAEAFGEQE